MSTAYYYRFLTLMVSFLRRVGASDNANTYAARAEAVRARFNRTFWNAAGWYAGPGDGDFRQTNNLLAVSFGLAEGERRSAVLQSLERDLRARDMHLDTGMVGTRQLLRVLARHLPRLAFEVVRAPGYPGWSHWIGNGATTLYENWELDGRSHDHAMFGSIDEWLFADVAGLSPGADGWSVVRLDPRLPGDGAFACRASLDTISGPIDVEWEDRGPWIRGRVTVPNHVSVVVPGGAGVERGRRSVRRGRLTEHTIELAVPSAP
ncbi:alpha-L-rhamnosidase C-terminal domain-containing protein [Leifsonia sp. SIMBA_070]|uniref:alpha-L-rhamnosidase-related protein n=1 Tax=Leifsonia sp. SIMBA_070 TaxID=3085810 RepID=UPI0039791516